MADYHPLIARAVEGLENSTGEARRALYERARAALVAQLRSIEPALSEADITRERLALEDAIRKVEAESVRKARGERAGAAAASGAAQGRRFSRPRRPAARDRRRRRRSPCRAAGSRAPCRPRHAPNWTVRRRRGPNRRRCGCRPRSLPTMRRGPRPPGSARARLLNARTSPVSREGLRGFRDVVNEVDDLGAATRQVGTIGARHARLLWRRAGRNNSPTTRKSCRRCATDWSRTSPTTKRKFSTTTPRHARLLEPSDDLRTRSAAPARFRATAPAARAGAGRTLRASRGRRGPIAASPSSRSC